MAFWPSSRKYRYQSTQHTYIGFQQAYLLLACVGPTALQSKTHEPRRHSSQRGENPEASRSRLALGVKMHAFYSAIHLIVVSCWFGLQIEARIRALIEAWEAQRGMFFYIDGSRYLDGNHDQSKCCANVTVAVLQCWMRLPFLSRLQAQSNAHAPMYEIIGWMIFMCIMLVYTHRACLLRHRCLHPGHHQVNEIEQRHQKQVCLQVR
jgi:hypothetical protein